MTKWFDTNYHYLVPEISPSTTFALDPSKVLSELAEALSDGIAARPVVIGPVTFLLLSKAVGTDEPLLSRLEELLPPLYADLLGRLAKAGASWVQLDEPALVGDRTDEEIEAARAAYEQLSALSERPSILLASYFGSLREALPALASTDVEGFAVDLVAGQDSIGSVPRTRPQTGRRRCGRRTKHLAVGSGFGTEHVGCSVGQRGYSCRLHIVLPAACSVHSRRRGRCRQGPALVARVRHREGQGSSNSRNRSHTGRESVEDEFALARAAASTRKDDRRLNDASVRGDAWPPC